MYIYVYIRIYLYVYIYIHKDGKEETLQERNFKIMSRLKYNEQYKYNPSYKNRHSFTKYPYKGTGYRYKEISVLFLIWL